MKRKKAQVEKPSVGTLRAAKARAESNRLTDAQRETLGEEFLKLYYGAGASCWRLNRAGSRPRCRTGRRSSRTETTVGQRATGLPPGEPPPSRVRAVLASCRSGWQPGPVGVLPYQATEGSICSCAQTSRTSPSARQFRCWMGPSAGSLSLWLSVPCLRPGVHAGFPGTCPQRYRRTGSARLRADRSGFLSRLLAVG